MTDQGRKTYVTTARAGFTVACRRVPGEIREDVLSPKIGHELSLTDEEAAHELSEGTIELKDASRQGAKSRAVATATES